ncbi:uncharacterized protein [Oscarella lobularis]|uniref:uncharacterized protein n=1 Tax=Oscarella lobularis TaxID=121494 RepID=UPI0033136DF2
MIAYRRSDVVRNYGERKDNGSFSGRFCGVDSEEHHVIHNNDFSHSWSRLRRAVPARHTCPIALVADHKFYQTLGGRSFSGTINFMVSVLQHPRAQRRIVRVIPPLSDSSTMNVEASADSATLERAASPKATRALVDAIESDRATNTALERAERRRRESADDASTANRCSAFAIYGMYMYARRRGEKARIV